MTARKVRSLLIHILIVAAILTACAPASTEAPAATEPAQPVGGELNVLCTPQEQWCQGMKQEFEA